MAFSVALQNDTVFPVIYLYDTTAKTTAEIYAFGGLLNAFTINNSINIIDGFSSPQDAIDNITKGFKSAKLSPFVCRTANGKFSFKNQEYTIGKFFLKQESIHGLLYDAPFTIIDSGSDANKTFVQLQYEYSNKKEGFPFNYTCTIIYTLESGNHLSIETTIKNNAAVEMPVCDGWHPYFMLGETVNELSFKMNAYKMLEFDERLLPTGNIINYKKFQQPEIFGDTVLDNCFVLNDTNKPACVLKNNKTGLQLSVQPNNAYPYLQFYTPPHRKSIAIENLSAAPDAFNNKIGLKILKSSEEISFKTSYSATIKL